MQKKYKFHREIEANAFITWTLFYGVFNTALGLQVTRIKDTDILGD